ncbi:MAG TPA: hypothetical protein VF154_17280 [Terriglobales bacterium]
MSINFQPTGNERAAANDNAVNLAKGLRAALDKTNSAQVSK